MSGENTYQIAEWRLCLLKMAVVFRWAFMIVVTFSFAATFFDSRLPLGGFSLWGWPAVILLGLSEFLQWIAFLPDGTQPARHLSQDRLQLYWIAEFFGHALFVTIIGLMALVFPLSRASMGKFFAVVILLPVGLAGAGYCAGILGFQKQNISVMTLRFPTRDNPSHHQTSQGEATL